MLEAGHMQIDFDRNGQNTYELEHEYQRGSGGTGSTVKQDMLDCYKAMLQAAPKPGEME
jgi:hypothetical protein